MNTEKYLPLGSIVTIEKYDKDVMIIGYMAYSEDKKDEIVSGDYVGIPLNEGYKIDKKILFNKENITNVIFMGYKTQQTINQLELLDESLKVLKTSKNAKEFINEMYAKTIVKGTNSDTFADVKSAAIKDIDEGEK